MFQYSASVLAWLEDHPQPEWIVKYPSPPLPDVRTTRYNFVYFGTYRDVDVWWDSIKGTSVRALHGDIMGFTQFGDNGENVKGWIDIYAYNNWRREKGVFVPPTPLIPTGYTYSWPPPEIAEPPWPFNWIRGVFEGAGGLGEFIGGGLGFLSSGLLGIGTVLTNLPAALFRGLIDGLNELMTKGSEESLNLATKTLEDAVSGSPENMTALETTAATQAGTLIKNAGAIQMEIEKGASGIEPKKAWKTLKEMSEGIIGTSLGLYLQHCAVEGGSLGQFEFVQSFDSLVLKNYAYAEISKRRFMMPAEMSILKPAMYHLNSIYQPEIPPYTDLVNMRVKEKITAIEFRDNLLKLGFSPKWSALIWDAHFQAPSYGDIVKAYYRGAFDYDRLVELMERVDLDPEYNEEVFLKLIEEIPPYSELVNQRVKEVLTQKEFDKYIKYYGFDPAWSGRIWDAHFTPAAFADFLTAMRRKETVNIPVAGAEPISHTFGADAAKDAKIIKNLSILADYDPRYWSFFKTRIYNDPTPRMARWAFEVGALTPEQVAEVVHRFGYRPEDEEWFTNMLIGFQERPWVTKYLTAISTAYIRGAVTEEELKKRVVKVAGRNEKVAEWIVEIAKVKLEIGRTGATKAPKLLGISDLKKAFLRDKINEDILRRELMNRGYEIGDVDILVSLLEDEKTVSEAGGRVVALSITQLLSAWRFKVVEEDHLRTELMLRGLSQEEVEQLIETKKRQWKISPAG